MTSIVDQLIEAGFTPLQARVYVGLLSLGEATAGEIAKVSEVNRVTSYTTLNELTEMGLVIAHNSDAVRTFRTGPLQNLESLFMHKAKNASETYRNVQSLIPDLTKIAENPLPEPKVDYIEGQKKILQYLSRDMKNDVVASVYIAEEGHYEIIKSLVKRAADADFRPKAIIPNSLKASLLVYLDHRVIPAKIAHFVSTTIITDTKVVILMDDSAVWQILALEDTRIVQFYQSMFDLSWRIISGEHMIVTHNS